MTRAERRRQERLLQKANKTYNLSVKEIEEMKMEAFEEALNTSFKLMLGIPLIVLRDKYGFGKKRLNDYIDYVLEEQDSFNKGYFTLEDVEQMLYEEVDIKLKDIDKE